MVNRKVDEVTSMALRQGAWYAMEQAGRLLASASLVADWSTPLGIAMLGREELGRSRIHQALAKDVDEGKSVLTVPAVNKACESHESRQRRAALSTSLHAESGSELGRQMHQYMRNPPTTETWLNANDYLRLATERKSKRQHNDRHELRMRAFYISLEPSGTRWQRPSEIPHDQARDEVFDAVNDYAGERDRLRAEVLREDFPEISDALEGMDPPPRLSQPVWPKGI